VKGRRSEMAQILDGKKVAREILKPIKKGLAPTLAIILVGKEPKSLIYVREKRKKAKEIGIKTLLFKFKKEAKESQIKNLIKKLNQDPKVHGILVELPLASPLNPEAILKIIDPKKEVDGLTSRSPYPPACASGIMKLLSFYKIQVKDKKVVILGKGRVVGRPLSKLMKKAGAKVTLCDEETKNLKSKTKKAEILIGATPIEDIIKPEMVKKGAVVIDASRNVREDVKKVASYLTPKIGGVGPVTVAMLLKNLIEAAGA